MGDMGNREVSEASSPWRGRRGRRAGAVAVAMAVAMVSGGAGCTEAELPVGAEPLTDDGRGATTGPPAAPGTQAIAAVDNGFGGDELRQSSSASITITGTHLAGATRVTVGTMDATIDRATATELRASLFVPYGYAPGPVDVTVETPAETMVAPAALEVTPYVLAPTGAIGGRGTYESPMHLCDPALQTFANGPGYGDLVQLLGGVHACAGAPLLAAGITIEGALDGSTIVQGVGDQGFQFLFYPDPTRPTAIRRISFAAPRAQPSILFSDGDLTLERIRDGEVQVESGAVVIVEDYHFEGPTGATADDWALDLVAFDLTLTDVAVRCEGGSGIRVAAREQPILHGEGVVERVRVEHCERGLQIGRLANLDEAPQLELEDVELFDNRYGLSMTAGYVTAHGLEVSGDPLTPLASEIGIDLANGYLFLLGGETRGQLTGISQQTSGGGGFEPVAVLSVDGHEIIGGRYGIEFYGYDNGTQLGVRNSTIRDQTAASVLVRGGYESHVDLGTISSPGNNALSVVSGYAIDERRSDTLYGYEWIDAHGTTLNALGYDGNSITGPARIAPDFRIWYGVSGIRF